MKIPHKDDPGGDKECAVPLNVVLSVLEANDVQVIELEPGIFTLSNSEEVDAQAFGAMVGGLAVKRLARLFSIPLIEFYYDPLRGGRRRPRAH